MMPLLSGGLAQHLSELELLGVLGVPSLGVGRAAGLSVTGLVRAWRLDQYSHQQPGQNRREFQTSTLGILVYFHIE